MCTSCSERAEFDATEMTYWRLISSYWASFCNDLVSTLIFPVSSIVSKLAECNHASALRGTRLLIHVLLPFSRPSNPQDFKAATEQGPRHSVLDGSITCHVALDSDRSSRRIQHSIQTCQGLRENRLTHRFNFTSNGLTELVSIQRPPSFVHPHCPLGCKQ